MAIGVIAIVAVAALAIGIYVASQMKPPGGQDMSPATLDSFQITRAQEGHCVPFITGTVRQTGNILWYGNLTTTEVEQEVGGKGSSEKITTGYQYYLDIWQAICLGEAELVSVYVNDRAKILSDLGNYTENNGTTDTFYPTQPGAYANRLKGVHHVFMNQYYLGENVSAVPTIHFIVKSVSACPLTYANMTGGTNPAAVIWDLLVFGGAVQEDFNVPNFQAAATYFYNKGYAINIAFTKQKEVREHINDVLNYIEAGFDIDAEGKFTLTPFDPTDVSAFSVDKDDFIKFNFTRRAWKDTYNDFRANYTDADKAYTTRTLRTKNPANKRMVGYTRQKTVDLTAFTDVEVVSQRLWEIMQRFSYPEAQIDCTLPFKYATYPIGTVMTISHSDYGISNAEFRILKKDVGEYDTQEVKVTAVQMVEKLADDNYTSEGGGKWVTPDYSPQPFVHEKVFELPYNPITGGNKAYLLLGAREGTETSFIVQQSNLGGADYVTVHSSGQFSQRGLLNGAYPDVDTTFTIDDEVGLIYTPYKEDPEFSSVNRVDLFTAMRIAIVGNEVMAFQTVTPSGVSDIKLTGIIRGLFNTPISSHSSGSEIWITKLDDNVLTGVTSTDFKLKLLPSDGVNTVDPGDVSAITVRPTSKAADPWDIGIVEAVRSGSSVVITWYNSSQYYDGAGKKDNDEQQDQDPFLFEGDFRFQTNIPHDEWIEGNTKTITYVGSFTLTITPRLSGNIGNAVSFAVGSTDGTYTGPTGLY